jgi:hypothetical protein
MGEQHKERCQWTMGFAWGGGNDNRNFRLGHPGISSDIVRHGRVGHLTRIMLGKFLHLCPQLKSGSEGRIRLAQRGKETG